jgi:hypothetical protein
VERETRVWQQKHKGVAPASDRPDGQDARQTASRTPALQIRVNISLMLGFNFRVCQLLVLVEGSFRAISFPGG